MNLPVFSTSRGTSSTKAAACIYVADYANTSISSYFFVANIGLCHSVWLALHKTRFNKKIIVTYYPHYFH